jgi:preprotein translocase subunit Sec63
MKNFLKDKFLPFLGVVIFIGAWHFFAVIFEEKFFTWFFLPLIFILFIVIPLTYFIFIDRPIVSKDGHKYEKVKMFAKEHTDYLKKETWKNTRPLFTFIGICTVLYWIYLILIL